MDIDKLLWLYKTMVRSRYMEEALLNLYRQGKVPGTLHLSIGQEATEVGVIAAMQKGDLLLATYRSHCPALAIGIHPKYIISEVLGKASGVCGGIGGSMHLSEPQLGLIFTSAIVASQIPVAAGIGYALRYLKRDNVVVVFVGDGGVNNGDFHEGLNFAAILNAPVVVVIVNNQYAISMPVHKSTKVKDLATKAIAYGIEGIIVDGMNPIEVYTKAKEAIEKVRSNKTPILIEAKTYRFLGHYAGDVDQPYRSKEEVEEWKKRDPILYLRNIIKEKGFESKILEIEAEAEKEIADAVEFALNSPYPEESKMFENLW
jgi:Pyruvate/2-oxoglutarate dehydrogenase complex, dehydrogenase (E1) component, eukaryotic type, alpha subunit